MVYLKSALFYFLFVLAKPAVSQVNSAFEERVDFSIPKSVYFTGEKIWLSIEVESDSKPSPSKVVYAELLNRLGESFALSKIPLQNGEAFNYLTIPDELESDHYLLRVFTRVSPYESLELGLVQEFVTVFNPQIPPEVVAERPAFSYPDQDSNQVSLSATSVSHGEEVEITYGGEDRILEWKVAVSNPFLKEMGKIPSLDVYENLLHRTLVPEYFGHIVEAKIERDSAVSEGSDLFFFSLHGEKSVLFTDRPDQDGRMFFDAGGWRHWEFMVAQRKDNRSMVEFEIVSPSPKTKFKPGFQFPELRISPSDRDFLTELLRGSQLEGYFVQEFKNDPMPVVIGFVQDRTFRLDDYNRFDKVETHIREYVPEVAVRTRDKSKELRILNALQNRSFTSNPLLLVDAMPVADVEKLLEFNPAKFEKMEILTRQFFLNEEVYPGVISFSSFRNDFGGFALPDQAVYIPYPGLNSPVTDFGSLFNPAKGQNQLPDWRTVLFWSATGNSLTPSKTIRVTAPVLKSIFLVILKTVDSEGKVKMEYRQFEVGER